MPLHVSSISAHHQEVKIVLHSLWYHHTYRCDDTRGCVMQFWPPDDEHVCSKHVKAWNKIIVKQKFCASSWLITEINILRCTVSKTSTKYWCCSVSGRKMLSLVLQIGEIVYPLWWCSNVSLFHTEQRLMFWILKIYLNILLGTIQ